MDLLNDEAACELFYLAPGHGVAADDRWWRPFPPRGTVTMEINDRKVDRFCAAGLAVAPPRHSKGRIYIGSQFRDSMNVMVHELGHVAGLGHKCHTIMGGVGCADRPTLFDEEQRDKLRRKCDAGDD